MSYRRHILIPALFTLVLAVAGDVVIAVVLHLPPGYATTSAADQTVTGQIFAIMAWDVGIAVVIFGLYFAVTFSRGERSEEERSGATSRSNVPLQAGWIGTCIVLVLFAAGYGTVELEGQTAPSLVVPAKALAAGAENHPFIVQVIAQQWQFTYRYPSLGGLESQELRLPVGRLIQFDVTSLDVTHQFWAYQLGVKIDANQGVNNIGYAYINRPTVIDVRCGELCGLWHGYMTDIGSQAGRALSAAQFASWERYARRVFGPETKLLPKFALTYVPQPAIYGS